MVMFCQLATREDAGKRVLAIIAVTMMIVEVDFLDHPGLLTWSLI